MYVEVSLISAHVHSALGLVYVADNPMEAQREKLEGRARPGAAQNGNADEKRHAHRRRRPHAAAGEMQQRYSGDAGEMQGRCSGDAAEMQGRSRTCLQT